MQLTGQVRRHPGDGGLKERLVVALSHVAGLASPGSLISHKVVLPKSISTQIRQLTLYTSNFKGYVDGFVAEFTSVKDL